MRFRVINDLHLGAPNALFKTKEHANIFTPESNVEIYLGDNFDLANCSKDDVLYIRSLIIGYKEKYGARFITGNHERQRDEETERSGYMYRGYHNDKPYLIHFQHGDFVFWGQEKSKAYRAKEWGAGFLKRGLWVNFLEALEQGYDRKLNGVDLFRAKLALLHASKIAAFDTSSFSKAFLVVGHLHPKKNLFIELGSNTYLLVLKRGVNDIDFTRYL